MRLLLGVGPYPIHPQHQAVMDSYGGNWVYIDKYVKQEDTLNYDVEKLPYKNNSIDTIYASHLLEHMSHRKLFPILKHWADLLKPGGEIYINVPDIEWACTSFLEILQKERNNLDIGGYYNYSLSSDNYEHSFDQIFYGSHEHDGEYHKSCYTKDFIRELLEKVGLMVVSIDKVFEAHEIGCLIAIAKKV